MVVSIALTVFYEFQYYDDYYYDDWYNELPYCDELPTTAPSGNGDNPKDDKNGNEKDGTGENGKEKDDGAKDDKNGQMNKDKNRQRTRGLSGRYFSLCTSC